MKYYPSSLAHSIGILVAAALLFAGCSDSIQPLERQDPLPETPPGEFQPVSGSADVYDRESPARFGSLSRYVLYEDGTFELQTVSGTWGFHTRSGDYVREGSKLAFAFASDSRWKATGTLEGTHFNIEYNLIMALSGFEDGVYVLVSGAEQGGSM